MESASPRSEQVEDAMVAGVLTEQRTRLSCIVAVVGRLARFLRLGPVVSVGCHSERTDSHPAADVNGATDLHVRSPLAGVEPTILPGRRPG